MHDVDHDPGGGFLPGAHPGADAGRGRIPERRDHGARVRRGGFLHGTESCLNLSLRFLRIHVTHRDHDHAVRAVPGVVERPEIIGIRGLDGFRFSDRRVREFATPVEPVPERVLGLLGFRVPGPLFREDDPHLFLHFVRNEELAVGVVAKDREPFLQLIR